MIYTRVQYCKSPSSLCYLCRSWIVHCVGLLKPNASIASSYVDECHSYSTVYSKLMADAREDRVMSVMYTQCLLAVHCLLLNSNVRLLASVCILMFTDYSCSSITNRLLEEHAANTNICMQFVKARPTMSCSRLVTRTRDFVT